MKPKILVLVDWYKPAFKAGGPVKSISNLIDLLHEEYDFYVLTGDRDLGDTQPYPSIELDRWMDLKGCKVRYWSNSNQGLSALKEIINELKVDLLYVNGVYSKVFSFYPVWLFRSRAIDVKKVVVAPRGMIGLGARHKKRLKKSVYLNFYKRMIKGCQNLFFQATDSQEVEDVQEVLNVERENIHVIGNVPDHPLANVEYVEKKEVLKLVLISRLAVEKNILELVDTLGETNLAIELDLYGRFNSEKYKQKVLAKIDALPENVTVRPMGLVLPEVVPSTLQKYHALITLTKGENFGHSIFEALSVGRPVIISERTPWGDVHEKSAGFVVTNKDECLSVLEQLSQMNQETFNQFCKNANDFAKQYYHESEFKPGFLNCFKIDD